MPNPNAKPWPTHLHVVRKTCGKNTGFGEKVDDVVIHTHCYLYQVCFFLLISLLSKYQVETAQLFYVPRMY